MMKKMQATIDSQDQIIKEQGKESKILKQKLEELMKAKEAKKEESDHSKVDKKLQKLEKKKVKIQKSIEKLRGQKNSSEAQMQPVYMQQVQSPNCTPTVIEVQKF